MDDEVLSSAERRTRISYLAEARRLLGMSRPGAGLPRRSLGTPSTPLSAFRKSSAPSSNSHVSWLANRCPREVRRMASTGGRPFDGQDCAGPFCLEDWSKNVHAKGR